VICGVFCFCVGPPIGLGEGRCFLRCSSELLRSSSYRLLNLSGEYSLFATPVERNAVCYLAGSFGADV